MCPYIIRNIFDTIDGKNEPDEIKRYVDERSQIGSLLISTHYHFRRPYITNLLFVAIIHYFFNDTSIFIHVKYRQINRLAIPRFFFHICANKLVPKVKKLITHMNDMIPRIYKSIRTSFLMRTDDHSVLDV